MTRSGTTLLGAGESLASSMRGFAIASSMSMSPLAPSPTMAARINTGLTASLSARPGYATRTVLVAPHLERAVSFDAATDLSPTLRRVFPDEEP